MSKLTKQNFGFGAGLTALFDSTPGIMPSLIEDATELVHNGKRTKVTTGKFYKIVTPKENEFIVYIKYSDSLIRNDNMVSGFMWQFGLSEVEKEKIELQYEKTGTFLILLVCISPASVDIDSQVALLTWEDYCAIRERNNIQIGIWNNPEVQQQRSKMFYLRKGKGQKKEYFHTIKRNILKKMNLDEFYSSTKEDIVILNGEENEFSGNLNYVETESELIPDSVFDKRYIKDTIYIKDNVKWCGRCRCKTERFEYNSTNVQKNSIDEPIKFSSFKCPQCKKIYISTDYYKRELAAKDDVKKMVSFQRIKTLVDKVYEASEMKCACCHRTLAISPCRMKIYFNLESNNQLEKIVDEELFYCENCGLYYVTPQWQRNLVKKYGRDKINFTSTNNMQQKLSLL